MADPKTFVLQLIEIPCDCYGCEKKMKKLLKKINGVHTIAGDLKQGKVTIQGIVDPHKVIKKLKKNIRIKAVLCGNNPVPEPVQEFNDQHLVSQVQQISHINRVTQMEVTYSKTVKVRFIGNERDESSRESDTQKKIVMNDDEGGGAAASRGGAASSGCYGHHGMGNKLQRICTAIARAVCISVSGLVC
ncbi:heavy metal-associated isoprenylated plant protein 24-like [Actinidia eriantha]|uniref:heavy metal-associated isoprenylated plant protein 24-like n=1 Tax=Actinidia eriantha TaxID=165200 RepID=UPI00258D0DAE|nr:heavy metal-associated isoprenylated plant protein 24-like [Actinidia eriantha]